MNELHHEALMLAIKAQTSESMDDNRIIERAKKFAAFLQAGHASKPSSSDSRPPATEPLG